MLSHTSLTSWYMTHHLMKDEFGYSLTELDDLIPFERDLYVDLHMQRIQEKKKIAESINNG